MAADTATGGRNATDHEGLLGFVSELRAGITLTADSSSTQSEPPRRASLGSIESDVLEVDLATLRAARESGRTIDKIMQRAPGAIKVLARYGIYTTMNVARDPGGLWRHYQDRSADRILGRMAARVRKALAATPGYEHVSHPADEKKISRTERRLRERARNRDIAILAIKTFCAPIEERISDIGIDEAKVARHGRRKGEVVDGTVYVGSTAYLVPEGMARLVASTWHAYMRSDRLDAVHPIYMDSVEGRPGIRTVEVAKATEFTNRVVGAVTYRLLEEELRRYGFVSASDKRSPADSLETFHPVIEQLQTDLNAAYQRIPVSIYKAGEFVRSVLKDPGLLIQEASHAFQAWRDAIRETIETMRETSANNAEHHKSIRLLLEGKDVLRRRKVSFGKAQPKEAQRGPNSARGRNPHEVAIDYANEFGERFKANKLGTLVELMADTPKGLLDALVAIGKFLPRIAVGGWRVASDTVSWARKKHAARKDTTVDKLIADIEAVLATRN